MSGFGAGCQSVISVSIEASTQLPSFTIAANDRSCVTVLPRSAVNFGKRDICFFFRLKKEESPGAIISLSITSRNSALWSDGKNFITQDGFAGSFHHFINLLNC
ncbi:MAG: hypothetical protein WKF89_18470 [Chitinophagaceae bacterium]